MAMSTQLQTWREKAQFFTAAGGDIAYWTAGDEAAPALFLIHGFPTASWDWSKIWDRLSARYRLIALDMLGFGFSAKPAKHTYRLVYQADLHEALAKRLGVERAHILAHDYGDSVAQELVARKLDGAPSLDVISTVYLNGGLIPDGHRPRRVQKLLAGRFGFLVARLLNKRSFAKSFREIFAPASQPDAEEIEDFWAMLAHRNGSRIGHRLISYIAERRAMAERWVGALSASAVPQRFICGALDPVSGRHLAELYQERVENPDVVLLDQVGHYPQWEAPDDVLAAFDAFHERLAGATENS